MTGECLLESFQQVEDNFSDALISNDSDKISKFLSDDWVLLEPEFGIISKEKFLNAIETNHLSHSNMIKKVVRVQLYNDVAIVTTRGMNVGIFRDQEFNAEQWVTNIYKKAGGSWICIMTQEAPVICK